MNKKRIIVANPHGFCSGVSRAVDAIQAAIKKYPPPVYCYHEVVHNQQVADMLTKQGVVFVESLDGIPHGSALLLSAHGVAPEVRHMAQAKDLLVIDATCPFVARAHAKVKRLAARGCSILLIGHRNHEEVIGVAAEAPEHVTVIENENEARTVRPPHPEAIGVVTQTTLSVRFVDTMIAILRERFPRLDAPQKGDICYATQNRQLAVEQLANQCDGTLVLGSRNSSNSLRLTEIAQSQGKPAFLLSTRADLNAVDLSGIHTLGLTSGASTPEFFLEAMIDDLKRFGFTEKSSLSVSTESTRSFPLPKLP